MRTASTEAQTMRSTSEIPSMLLNVADSAVALAVSPRTVRALIARKELTVVRIGRRVLVSPLAIERFIRDREAAETK